jgi:hypothetical protein
MRLFKKICGYSQHNNTCNNNKNTQQLQLQLQQLQTCESLQDTPMCSSTLFSSIAVIVPLLSKSNASNDSRHCFKRSLSMLVLANFSRAVNSHTSFLLPSPLKLLINVCIYVIPNVDQQKQKKTIYIYITPSPPHPAQTHTHLTPYTCIPHMKCGE